MKVKSENEVAQSCPTLSDHMDYSPPGSSVHGIFQARVLEWVAIAFSTKMSLPSKVTYIPTLKLLFLGGEINKLTLKFIRNTSDQEEH